MDSWSMYIGIVNTIKDFNDFIVINLEKRKLPNLSDRRRWEVEGFKENHKEVN